MAHIAIRSGPLCESGSTQLGRVADAISCEWTEQIGGDRGTCRLVLPRDSASVSLCAIFNVLRIVDDDAAVWEYRIARLVDGPTQETVIVEAVDLSHDLGRVRLSAVSGGLEQFTYAPGLLSPSSYIDTYVLPALTAAGITWVVKGTITPTASYSISWQRSTPLAVLTALEEATKYEFWLERNGDTNYKIMLGRRSASGTPVAFVGRNVEALERTIAADERFYNRAIPVGATVSGESEATGIGQNGWRISSVSSNDVTLANPNGGTGPIGTDDQLNGLIANIANDGIVPPLVHASSVSNTGRGTLAYDYTRRIVWWVCSNASGSGHVLAWHDLRDNTKGTLAISGSTSLMGLCYVASRDEIFVACNDASKVERINASTKASAGNLATAASPSIVRDLNEWGKNELAVSFSAGSTGVEVWNLTALTKSATMTGPTANDHWCIWDSVNSRYFIGSYGAGTVYWYSSAYAYVNQGTPFGGSGVCQVMTDGAGTHYLCKYAGQNMRSLNGSTGTFGTDTALANYAGAAFTFPQNHRGFYVGGRCYVVIQQTGTTSRYTLISVDPSDYSIDTGVRIDHGSGPIHYDATDDVFLYAEISQAPLVCLLYRNGNERPSGRLRFAIQDTVNATQVITKPGATKGPILAEQLVEVRANTSEDYLTALTDPASVATYGPVDGFPAFTGTYKRNYKHDPYHARWASNLPALTGIGWANQHANATSVGSLKWDRSVAQTSSLSTSAQVNGNQTLAAGVRTLNVKALAASRVVQVGTVVYHATSAACVGFVLANATADGSGLAALTIYASGTTFTDGQALSLYCPSQAEIASSYAVALPLLGTTSTGVVPLLPFGAVHLPRITNASQAWIRLSFYCIAVGANATDLKVRFRGHAFSAGAGYTELAAASRAGGTAASPSTYALTFEQQIDMSGLPSGSDAFLYFNMPSGMSWTNASFIAAWLTGIEVYVATSSSCPSPQGATPGDELTPWLGANDLLFTQGRSSPTIDYTVQFIEDETAVRVGQTVMLRDPSLGIAASPRIVAVTRQLRRDAGEIARPIVQLNNRTLSAMEALAGVGD